jgi:transposase
MSAERLAMRTIKEILRLYFDQGLRGSRKIATAAGCSKTMVNQTLKCAARSGFTSWADVAILSEEELEAKLCPATVSERSVGRTPKRCAVPDWAALHEQLHRPDHKMTLRLLWNEYKNEHPDGYQYSRFTELYRNWQGKLSLVMRQEHHAGEKAFVDFCDGLGITDPNTGKVTKTELFVGVLGASSYTFVLATPTQKIGDWIECHRQMYEFFGGVPAITVPDNLKSGIRKPDRYEAEPNSTYREMAMHYGTCIIPARVRKPRDKAKAEAGVLVAQRWILAALRDRTFYSLFELNEAIAELLERLNRRTMRHLKKSRRELWEALDRPALKPLPATRYEFAAWKKVRLNIDYHVEYEGHYYSAPFALARQELWVRATNWSIEIFHKGKRVASHARSRRSNGMTTTPEHMPSSHRAHAEWTPSRVIQWAHTVGPETARVVEHLIASKIHPEQGFRSAMGILGLAKLHGADRVEKAARKVLLIGAPGYQVMKIMLKNRMEEAAQLIAPPAAPSKNNEEMVARQTDLLAAENIRGKTYYH